MNIDVEFHIRHNYPWSKLPANVRQVRLEPGTGPQIASAPPHRHLFVLLVRGARAGVSRPTPPLSLVTDSGKPPP
jgi:hypothetical protein